MVQRPDDGEEGYETLVDREKRQCPTNHIGDNQLLVFGIIEKVGSGFQAIENHFRFTRFAVDFPDFSLSPA